MKTKNPWPLAIILTFVIFISGTAGLVVLACKQKPDLVTANYYDDEVRFQAQIDRSDRAHNLGAQAGVTYDAASHRITIRLPADQAQPETHGRIQLYRPSESALDQQLDLTVDSQGVQIIDTANLKNGLWKIKVSWTTGDADYFFDRKVVIGADKS